MDSVAKNKRGRPHIVFDNTLVVSALRHCPKVGSAKYFYPWMDNIIAGASCLDFGGNTRPVRQQTLYQIVCSLPEITTHGVMNMLNYSESYSKKLAAAARVISRVFSEHFRESIAKDLRFLDDPERELNLTQAEEDRAEYELWLAEEDRTERELWQELLQKELDRAKYELFCEAQGIQHSGDPFEWYADKIQENDPSEPRWLSGEETVNFSQWSTAGSILSLEVTLN